MWLVGVIETQSEIVCTDVFAISVGSEVFRTHWVKPSEVLCDRVGQTK